MGKLVFCYQHHIEKYEEATKGMSLIQHGAYRLLLDYYYRTSGKLPNDLAQLYRIVGCHGKPERDAVSYAVARFFTVTEDGFLSQKGAEKTLEKILKISEAQRRNANAKHLKYKETHHATAQPRHSHGTANHKPSTINQSNPNGLDSETVETPPPSEPEKPKEQANARKRKPATYITAEFEPDFEGIAFCQQHGLDVTKTTVEFVDYWLGIGKPMSDWQATFRNRVRKIAEYRAERQQGASHVRPGVRDVTGAALRAVAARREALNQA